MLKLFPQRKKLCINKLHLQRYFQVFMGLKKSGKRKSECLKVESDIYTARLEQAELVSQMAAGVANEIRNPLTVISGYVQLLRNRTELAQLKDYFGAMEEAIRQTDCLIDDFLTIAQHKQLQLTMVDLNQIIVELLAGLESKAKKTGCRVQTELAGDVPMLVNTKEIRQLIMIMAKNGIEAMPGGGVLTLKTYLDKGHVVLAISDEGNGISADVIDKLGTPFLSTKDEGSGLGIAICQGIAARHGASIFFRTGKEGTTFFIHFPLPNN